MNLNWFNNLINDKYNVSDASTTKMIGYKEAYPELIDRHKKTGFEQIDNLINEVDKHLFNKYNGYPYRAVHDHTVNDWYLKITGKNILK
jgi:hypothetical protein